MSPAVNGPNPPAYMVSWIGHVGIDIVLEAGGDEAVEGGAPTPRGVGADKHVAKRAPGGYSDRKSIENTLIRSNPLVGKPTYSGRPSPEMSSMKRWVPPSAMSS